MGLIIWKNVMCDVTLWTLFFHGVGNLISKNVKQVEVEILFLLLKKIQNNFCCCWEERFTNTGQMCVCVFGMKIGRHTKYTQGSCWSFQSVKHKETFFSLWCYFSPMGVVRLLTITLGKCCTETQITHDWPNWGNK